jgi:hypothetical protein
LNDKAFGKVIERFTWSVNRLLICSNQALTS